MKPKLLMLVLDGVRYDKLRASRTPHLDALAENGFLAPAWTHDNALGPTLSGNGHASMLTGVWADKHHSWDNEFTAINLDEYPSVFTRMKHLRPELNTFSSISWEPLHTHLVGDIDVKLLHPEQPIRDTDTRVIETAQQAVKEGADAVYAYLLQGDLAGHYQGVETPEYIDAIEHMDGIIGNLLETIREQPDDEDWLILVATDHGMTGKDHGGDEYTTRLGWVLASGSSVDPAASDHEWKLVDVAVTALLHMGIEIDPAWGLEGMKMEPRIPGAFDELLPQMDSYTPLPLESYPARTSTVPAGWARDGERAGWQFMTPHYWSWRLSQHGRGSFVAGRDVIAVCDPALDPASPPIDATLWSPDIDAEAAQTLCFFTHYRQLAQTQQRATVLAELASGEQITVWQRDSDAGEMSDLSTRECIDLPQGTVRVGWRYEAPPSASLASYWAISAPTFSATTGGSR